MPVDLTILLPHLGAWALVLFRITGIFVLAPVFSHTAFPAKVKLLWALGLSFCVYPVIYPVLLAPGMPSAAILNWTGTTSDPGGGMTLPAIVVAVAMELAIGVAPGYAATLPLVGAQMAGKIADQQIGLGLAGLFNPDLGDESSIIGEVYYMLAICLYLGMGGHRAVLASLLGSFERIPLGGFRIDGAVVATMVGLLSSALELCLRVAAPLLCLVMLETVAMGFIARTVPQLNLMNIGFPVRIVIGIGILAAALGMQAEVMVQSMTRTLRIAGQMVGGGP